MSLWLVCGLYTALVYIRSPAQPARDGARLGRGYHLRDCRLFVTVAVMLVVLSNLS
jgi:hypothetical protein